MRRGKNGGEKGKERENVEEKVFGGEGTRRKDEQGGLKNKVKRSI